MNTEARILVITDTPGDADQITALLKKEYKHVGASTLRNEMVASFQEFLPDIVVLAYQSIDHSVSTYLGILRHSTVALTLPHRAVVLCHQDKVAEAYELCRTEHFDDYVLFWPLPVDSKRLFMTIHHELRDLSNSESHAPSQEMVTEAAKIAELEEMLDQACRRGKHRADVVSEQIELAESSIAGAIDTFHHTILHSGLLPGMNVERSATLDREIQSLKRKTTQEPLRKVQGAVEPVVAWVEGIKSDLSEQIESARRLNQIVANDKALPTILMVDDDIFQCRLLQQILCAEPFKVTFALTGGRALTMIQRRPPDLILMDISLPDIDGIEMTRKLKAMKTTSQIPVVMVSGLSEKQTVVDSRKAGAADFLVKPIDKTILLEKVLRLLEKKPSHR